MKIKLDNGAYMPEYAHGTDAGADLRSPHDAVVMPRGSVVVDTGVHIELPPDSVGMLKSKSGLNMKGLQSEGVIDVGYVGSIKVKLYNHGDKPYEVKAGDKISQLVIMPVIHQPFELVDELEDTERGDNGFGSTGR